MMHHILESSVSLQQLPDVFGEICSHVDTYIFSLGGKESPKKTQSFFRHWRWKLDNLHALQRALYGFLEECMNTGKATFCGYQDSLRVSFSFTPMSVEGWGSCRDKLAKEHSWQNSCSCRSSQNWWILITSSEYLCSFHVGPSLHLLAVRSNCFYLCFSISPFPS